MIDWFMFRRRVFGRYFRLFFGNLDQMVLVYGYLD